MEPLDDRGRLVARLLADRYEVLGLLGKGGFAAVYQVRSRALKRLEALKVLLERHDEGPEFALRFTLEARVVASLEHPSIVKIYDFGYAEGTIWYSMQLVQGPTLSKRLAEGGRLDEETAARIGATLADALDYSHARGIIHRDIKPGNVILDTGGRPFLTDFGIAKVEDNLVQTQAGFILGSPPYLSPEQIRGETLDGRCDLYALGITLYQALSGSFPFPSDDPRKALVRRLTEDAPRLSEKRPEIHPELERIVMHALARNREARYPTASEMRDDLEAFLSAAYPRTIPSRPRSSTPEGRTAAPPLPPDDDTPTLKSAAAVPSRADESAPPPARGLPGPVRSRWPYIAAGAAAALVVALLAVSRIGPRAEPRVAIPDLRVVGPLPTPEVPTPGFPPPTPLPTRFPTGLPTPPPTPPSTPPEMRPTPRKAAGVLATRTARSQAPPDSGPVPRRVKYPADVVSDVPIDLPPDLSATCAGRTVGLHLLIGEDGSLRSATVISTSTVPACDAAALDAVKRYRFKPALDTEERPLEGRLLISVHF